MSKGERTFAVHLNAVRGDEARGWEAEYRFHPTRKWRFDFAWPEMMIAVEIEGGTWAGGRHSRGKGFEKDCEKYNEAAILGWTVLRFTTRQVTSGVAVETFTRALMARSEA